ncbi:hypothetical protein MMC29_007119 [Sticta canariensis]|nr:hypothetical protein [Sticta canariensis]
MSDINPEACDGLRSSISQGDKSASSRSSSATLAANKEPWSVSAGEHFFLHQALLLLGGDVRADENLEVSKLPFPIPANPTSPVPFFHLLERLKTTKREGWRRYGIVGESISDHMYRMAIITMLAPEPLASTLNIPHCTKMALVHDMAESLVGDITPVDNVPTVEKHRREAETMDFMTGTLLGKLSQGFDQGQGLREIFREYEDSKTKESVFVHDIDKMELVLQMMEYERQNQAKLDLSEFLEVVQKIQLEEVKEWCAEIINERDEYWSSKRSQASILEAREMLPESLD